MSATPAVRCVFALAVALLSGAPVAARDIGNAAETSLVWAPASAETGGNPGAGPLAPQVGSGPCFATPDNGATVFDSADAQAVRDALAAAAANGTVKVAGYCAGAQAQGGTTQVAWITQTVTLAGGYTTTDWTTYDPIGNPTTLDALQGGRVISAPVAATLRGFTVTGGYISSTLNLNGGGISAVGAMTLIDMIVSGNIVTGASGNIVTGASGGGVYAGATLALSGTHFVSNTAALDGGGAVAFGAATLNGGLFQSNASGNRGGGLYAFSTLALSGTQFISNTSSEGGGAYAFGAATLNGGLFQSNASGNAGGGLLARTTLALSGTQFLGNMATTDGGGLYLSNVPDRRRVVNALFARNGATRRGAAIYVGSARPLSLIHTSIVSPTAPTSATEAIYIGLGIVYLTNTLIATHTIGIARAGGLVWDWNTLFAGVSTPYSGTVTSVGGITGTAGFVNPVAGDYHLGAGSAAINAGVDAGVYTDFDGDVRPQGGGFDIGYDELSSASPTCYATPNDGTTVFSSTDAQAVRDALAAAAVNGTVKVAGYCAGAQAQGGTTQVAWITQTITLAGGYTTTDWTTYNPIGNLTTLDAQAGGRVIFASVAATLRGFTATNGYLSTPGSAHGGGIYAGAALTLTDLIVRGNEITGTAGGHSGGGVFGQAAVFVENTTISSNIAKSGGGGLYATGALSLVGGAVESNQGQDGAGLYANSTLALTGTRVVSNTALAGGWAGGAYVGSTASLTGAVFQGNTSAARGGGLYVEDALTLTDIQFISNTANEGGGVNGRRTVDVTGGAFIGNRGINKYGGLFAAYALTLADTRFIGNSSNGDGGGAFADDGATIERGLFQNNRSGGILGGGGLFVYNKLALTGTQFIGNVATVGGGMSLRCCTTSRMANALFAANQADSSRGLDIYVEDVALSLIHTTIASPTLASGSAVYGSNGGSVYLTNTLVASHTIGIDASAITAADWNTLFDSVATPYSGTVVSVGGITATAGFVDPAANDYHLSLGSAAVDSGIDAGVYSDFDGQARPQGAGLDIGYDELPAWLITPTAGVGGVIMPGAPQTVNAGGTAVFTVTPDTGYHVLDVGVDGASQGVLEFFAFTNVTADHTITAAFGINTYTITPTAGGGGSITPGTPQTVNYSGTAVFTITPDMGYHALDVGVDGVSQGALPVYTFTGVTADHVITAAFEINTYTLTMTTTAFIINSSAPTVTTPGEGSAGITPTVGVNPFSYGAVVTLTATAQFAWTFAGWTGDADCADGVVTMTANMSCAARFETWQTYVPRVLR